MECLTPVPVGADGDGAVSPLLEALVKEPGAPDFGLQRT